MQGDTIMDHIEELKRIVAVLRGDEGCPWDRQQTHESLKPACIEEAAEVLAGIDILQQTGKAENLREELGDLLLQVVFHAQLAAEAGRFTLDEVARAACDKMVRRHPHVFGKPVVTADGKKLTDWQEIKAQEKDGREWEEAYLPSALQEAGELLERAKVRKGIAAAECRRYIETLQLVPHPEGGYFAEIYTSHEQQLTGLASRPLAGSIYYLLDAGALSAYHEIDCDELWYYHAGCGVKAFLFYPDGQFETLRLGLNAAAGERPSFTVPAGTIFAARNLKPDGYTLMSCMTAPKFRYTGWRLVPLAEMLQVFPQHENVIRPFYPVP